MNNFSRLSIFFVICAAVGLTALSASLEAQTYFKCIEPSGKINFSDRPCNTIGQVTEHQQRTNSLDTSANREAMLRQENQALRERMSGLENGQTQQPTGAQPSNPGAQVQNKMECERATGDYQSAAGSIKPNSAQIEARRSAMFIACGQAEPAQVVAPARTKRSTVCSTSGQAIGGIYNGVSICR